jgi:hypothetical protein
MARRLDWPPTRISDMFNGRRGSKYLDVVKVRTVTGVVGDEAAETTNLYSPGTDRRPEAASSAITLRARRRSCGADPAV